MNIGPHVLTRAKSIGMNVDGYGLEIGAGPHKLPFKNTETLDICDDFDVYGKYKVDHLGFADNTEFSNNTFDFIVSSNVVEHFINPVKVFLEWHRILKPGGILYSIIPDADFFPRDRHRVKSRPEHAGFAFEEGLPNYPADVKHFSFHKDSWLKHYINGHKYAWISGPFMQAIDTYASELFETVGQFEHSKEYMDYFMRLCDLFGHENGKLTGEQINFERVLHRICEKKFIDTDQPGLYYHFEIAFQKKGGLLNDPENDSKTLGK